MKEQTEVRLCLADLEEWVTSGDDVTAEDVEQYITKYVGAMQKAMGDEYEVWATDDVIQDRIAGQPAKYASEEDFNAYNAAMEEVTSNWTW